MKWRPGKIKFNKEQIYEGKGLKKFILKTIVCMILTRIQDSHYLVNKKHY